METRAHFVLIGAFCVVAFLGALGFLVWVNKVQFDREFSEYDVVFSEAVTGLSVGSLVQFQGIQVGEVRKLRLDLTDPRLVIAHIRLQGGVPVHVDTKAKLTYSGLTGVATIQLTASNPAGKTLEAIPPAEYPVIASERSDLGALMNGGNDVMMSLDRALNRVNALLSEENVHAATQTLKNIDSLSLQLANSGPRISAAMDAAAPAIEDMRLAARQVQKAADALSLRIDALSPASIKALDADARAVLTQMRASLRQVDALTSTISQSAQVLSAQTLPQAGWTLSEVQELSRELRRLTEKFDRDPRHTLFGPSKIVPERKP